MTLKYWFQLICVLWLIKPLVATTSLAKPGCKDTCGNVTMPYPFGIGAGCFLHEWYEIVCLDDRPYLRKYYEQEFGGELLEVSLKPGLQTIKIKANNSRIRVCDEKGFLFAGNLSGTPFYYEFFKAFVVGCGNFMLFADQTMLGGCTSTCDQSGKINGCYGINCCQIIKPSFFIQQIYLNTSNSVNRSNSCASVILRKYHTYSDFPKNLDVVSVPVELQWRIPEWMGSYVKHNPNCGYSIYEGGFTVYDCQCPDCTEGNPYIMNGCQGPSNNTYCVSTSNSKRTFVLLFVGGTSSGMLALITASFLLYKTIRKRREKKIKEKFFKRNGGLLLQQQMSVDGNNVDKVRIFTASELGKATDNFNQNRILGHGGQGTVYKGMLADGKIVAIRKSKLGDKNQVEQFINEVVVLSQINHRNVVKLLGCCLETDVPLLVYEYIPNGTLYNLIHNEKEEFLMSWDMRLRIAIEVAEALAYLHSSTSNPVYHRDMKSSNILLDEKYKAKVSDFGTSKHFTIDQTHLTTMVKGTFGYLDPEYFQSSQFTEKSDVYSFGVVLVELLTGRKPISSNPTEEECFLGLASHFLTYMEEDRLNRILDSQVLETASIEQVTAVAKLAQRCLSLNGKERPFMKEVAMELESVKMSHMPSIVETNFQGESSTKVDPVVISNDIFSWTSAKDMVTPSSGAHHILPVTI